MGLSSGQRKNIWRLGASMTKIEWTEATWNPIVGCSIVSPGCTNCYAMKMAARIERMSPSLAHYRGLTQPSKAGPVWTGKVALASEHVLTEPLRRRKPTMYFVNSMGDLFHEDVPDGWIAYVWSIMMQCPQHTFQVLTKRSGRMRAWIDLWNDLTGDTDPMEFKNARGPDAVRKAHPSGRGLLFADYLDVLLHLAGGKVPDGAAWPTFDWMHGWKYWPSVPPNIWLGVSAERQQEADARIPDLLATPAAVRFVSAEPLLGPVDFTRIGDCRGPHDAIGADLATSFDETLDWIIVGGESGPGARPMHPDWARSIRDQCQAADVAFFFKQWGEWAPGPRHPVGSEAGSMTAMTCVSSTERRNVGRKSWLAGCGDHSIPLDRVGKARAGRRLDGRTWDEMPATAAQRVKEPV